MHEGDCPSPRGAGTPLISSNRDILWRMAHPPPDEIRSALLEIIEALGDSPHSPLQRENVFEPIKDRFGRGREIERAIIIEWQELFRTGLLAWGQSLGSADPPFFVVTHRGKQTLERGKRDPGNPRGYLDHLAALVALNPIAMSYLREGLDCFVAAHFKASVVMLGCAAESLLLELRDDLIAFLDRSGIPPFKGLTDWRAKTVAEAIQRTLDAHKSAMPRELQEEYEAYWPAAVQQVRATRNEAGHPQSVDPITADGAHASFLLFPEIARVQAELRAWMLTHKPPAA
jgi:hypothetical protein